ncbi:hypothetical protein [Mesorhizobium sp. ISC11]|uniref:hypothetical protein n=1 Tax=Mesorhizobium sp. ISC11 TaxID=3076428 RepID=UPI00301C03C9
MCAGTAVVIALIVSAEASAKECPPGHAANEQDDWKWIANNARRNADWYVVDHGVPEVAPAIGDVSVVYQGGGEYEGQYLVIVKQEGQAGIVFMMLRPRFDFCADVSSLDDARPDLFEVVVAKFNGRKF